MPKGMTMNPLISDLLCGLQQNLGGAAFGQVFQHFVAHCLCKIYTDKGGSFMENRVGVPDLQSSLPNGQHFCWEVKYVPDGIVELSPGDVQGINSVLNVPDPKPRLVVLDMSAYPPRLWMFDGKALSTERFRVAERADIQIEGEASELGEHLNTFLRMADVSLMNVESKKHVDGVIDRASELLRWPLPQEHH